jgi:hypothetical protein
MATSPIGTAPVDAAKGGAETTTPKHGEAENAAEAAQTGRGSGSAPSDDKW